MVEYHVDSSSEFQDRRNGETKFGENLSVRKQENECPLVMFRHDKTIFKRFYSPKRFGVGQIEKQCGCQKMKAKGL